jgi:hypothetical protein
MKKFYFITFLASFFLAFDASAQHTFLLKSGEARVVQNYSFSGDSVIYTARGTQRQIHRAELIHIRNANTDLVDPNNHRIIFYTGEVKTVYDFIIEDRMVTYMTLARDAVGHTTVEIPACMIEYIMSKDGVKHTFRRCSDIIYLDDGSEWYAREVISQHDTITFYEHGINAPFHNYPHHMVNKVLRYDEELQTEQWIDFARISDLEKKFRRKRGAKNFWMISTFLTAGAGAYLMYASEEFYNDYSLALDSNTAIDMRDNSELYEQIAMASFGAAVPMAIMTIVKAAQQNSAKKRWINHRTKMNFSTTTNGNGLAVGVQISF